MTEDEIQFTLFQHYRQRGAPGAVMFHIPNGGARHIATAARLKALGVVSGAPDLFCANEAGQFFVELKRDKGAVSKAQKELFERMQAIGCRVYTARGLDAALWILEEKGILRRAFTETYREPNAKPR